MGRAKELTRSVLDEHGMVIDPRGDWVKYNHSAKIIKDLEARVAELEASKEDTVSQR